MSKETLKIALPRKGRIAENIAPICREAGYRWSKDDQDKLFAKISDNVEVMFVRTTDVPRVVADGVVDIGITGSDLVEESLSEVNILEMLDLFHCRLVLAATKEFAENFEEKKNGQINIATSFPRLANMWAEQAGVNMHIVPLSGSVEIAPRIGIADAIIDLTQTGSSLRSNGLVEIETIREVSPCVVASKEFNLDGESIAEQEARTFIGALTAVLNAKGKRYLMMNVPKNAIDDVQNVVPGLSSPTVLDLYHDSDIVAVHVVIDVQEINNVVPKLKALGVTGILVTNIERLIP